MGKNSKLFGALLTAFLLWNTAALAATISATLDRDEMQVGEEAFLTITVTYEGGRVQPPNIMENSHLTINNMGTANSTSIVNFKRTDSIEYRYLVSADAPGVYNLENISAVVNKEVLRANPIRFKVIGENEQPRQRAGKSGISLEASLSDNSVYVGQQVIYKVKFLHKSQIAGANYNGPELGDFLSEQLGEQKNYETIIGNSRYAVTEIKMALFPTKPGKFIIEPATVKGDMVVRSQNRAPGGMFDDFFMGFGQSTKPFTVKSEALELEVRPLPVEGRPAGFSGLVGQFNLGYDLSKKVIKANESTTLTLVIEGYGNVPNLSIPAPGDNPNYKIYEDKPSLVKEARGEGIFGRYVAKWALVPSTPGSYQIPLLKLSYFDPEAGAYRVLQTPALEFAVTAGAAPEELKLTGSRQAVSGGAVKQQVAVLGEDVMPLSQDMRRFNQIAPRSFDNIWFWPLFVLPPLVWLVLVILEKRRNRSPEQLAKIRAAKAFGQLEADLTLALEEKSAERLVTAIRTYYAAKLQQAGCAITPDEVSVILRASGVDNRLAGQAAALLSQVEKALYIGASDEELAALITTVRVSMKEIDHAFSK